MRITRIEIAGLRRFEAVSLAPGEALNLLTGPNGAGKTSVLEAMHLMAYGRSFRGRVRDGLIRQGAAALEIFVEWQEASGRLRKAGLRHAGQSWQGRLDGADVGHLGELCAALAVVTFEPGSHDLVMGGAETRRRLLDWGLFHVEPDFLRVWRRYARALKQRNALLKAGGRTAELDVWEHELSESGEAITRSRETYLAQWQPKLAAEAATLAPALGVGQLSLQSGWRRDELSLADALLLARQRDLATGFTSVGPHRADFRIGFTGIPGRDALSRGQAKLTALALLLSQARLHAGLAGEWPVIALDDLASELDRAHQARVVDDLVATGAQVFVTGTDAPDALLAHAGRLVHVHVEEGRLRTEA
ncbi:DNA recombination and repair protein RecF [Lysobacter dokdonensis DS-58]|uniref:DNA replication and repair protein RecF n=1 Tax=Lysobacter dokdonensis DS-58 TaxID=1300345 RepID=A0A0A2WKF3_9GAMM|nr:DNA replication/repair protein RecF [Lysobacter dokdonensis]KGQ19177.1 DNA recombination and repair protein RecF [Lysobacter dokdonensis DS-58]